jgi:hypothetical protein
MIRPAPSRRAVLGGGLAALACLACRDALAAHAGLDRDALADAVRRVHRRPEGALVLGTFERVFLDVAALEAQIRALPPRTTLDDVLALDAIARGSIDYALTSRQAVVAACARRVSHAPARHEPADLVLAPNEQLVVPGSLTVDGRIVVHDGSRLIVAGDVSATDYVEDDGMGSLAGTYGALAVGGDLRLAGLCSTGGDCSVAGSLTAPVVLAYYNQGSLRVANGLCAELVFEYDHGDSEVFGPSRVGVLQHDELVGFGARQDGIEAIRARIAPALRADLPDPWGPEDRAEAELEAFLREHALARDLFADGELAP